MLYLAKIGVPAPFAIKAWKKFGTQAQEIVSQNPYVLCCEEIGVPFETADADGWRGGARARQLRADRRGHPARAAPQQHEQRTHLPARAEAARGTAARLVQTDSYHAADVLEELVARGELVRLDVKGEPFLYVPRYYEAECYIASKLSLMRDQKGEGLTARSRGGDLRSLSKSRGSPTRRSSGPAIVTAVTSPPHDPHRRPRYRQDDRHLGDHPPARADGGEGGACRADRARRQADEPRLTGRGGQDRPPAAGSRPSTTARASSASSATRRTRCPATRSSSTRPRWWTRLLFASLLRRAQALLPAHPRRRRRPAAVGRRGQHTARTSSRAARFRWCSCEEIFRQAAREPHRHQRARASSPARCPRWTCGTTTSSSCASLSRRADCATLLDLCCRGRLPKSYGSSPMWRHPGHRAHARGRGWARWSSTGMLQQALNPPDGQKAEKKSGAGRCSARGTR